MSTAMARHGGRGDGNGIGGGNLQLPGDATCEQFLWTWRPIVRGNILHYIKVGIHGDESERNLPVPNSPAREKTLCVEPDFLLLRLAADPLKGPGGNETDDQEIPTPETGRVLPGFSVHIGALNGDIEHRPFLGLLFPDAGGYGAVADLMNGLVACFGIGDLVFHVFCLVTENIGSD
jgi:hypothetical protein